MHFGDSIFIFLLALVLFGPKKLPEIGRTIGKLLAEFRRASNEFKVPDSGRIAQHGGRGAAQEARRATGAEDRRGLPATTAENAASPTILPHRRARR